MLFIRWKILFFFSVLILWPVIAFTSMQVPAPPQQQPVALVGGTIHPVSGPAIEGGTILFDKGKIVAIGRQVEIPVDAAVAELNGKHVYPGLISVGSVIGMIEVSSIRATRDFAEMGSINPNVRAERAINPGSEHIPVTRANGIALAAVLPAGGLISGMGALVMLDGWTWEQMTLKAPVCMALNWPNMWISSGLTSKKELNKRRARIKNRIEELEGAFKKARAYLQARDAADRRGVTFHDVDVRWEAMLPVLRRELPVWIAASRQQEIEAAIEWADREKVKMVLLGGTDAPLVTGLLKSRKIPVVLGPVHQLPMRRDTDYDEPFRLAARLHEAGVAFCIGGAYRSAGGERNLPYHTATAAAFGLPKDEALKAVTLYPAEILGVEDRVGSLEVGKDATLIVTDGDPLEITTRVEKLYIQGRDVDLNDKQKSLYAKYREKYRQQSGE
jgi:imidazolonepropionase-like amidohydrolase